MVDVRPWFKHEMVYTHTPAALKNGLLHGRGVGYRIEVEHQSAENDKKETPRVSKG